MQWGWKQATIVLTILVPLLWGFGSIVTGVRICAYRDTAHFYYPLYAWTAHCWSRGEIPLWNPQDNIGTPVVAEATSAVFYPGQLLFTLPLSYSFEFNLYLLLHVILAAAGGYLLARQLLTDGSSCGSSAETAIHAGSASSPGHAPSPDPYRAADSRDQVSIGSQAETGTRETWMAEEKAPFPRHLAAALCAVAYAFSGTVLFQYCNVVFLVGAAWLPWALLAADRMLSKRRLRWAIGLGICLALMVLGGDPQMAYHTGMLAALLAWIRRHRRRSRVSWPMIYLARCFRKVAPSWSKANRRTLPTSPEGEGLSARTVGGDSRSDIERSESEAPRFHHVSVYRHALFLLLAAATVGIVLSAVQIVPAVTWTHVSQRAASDDASVWQRVFGKASPGTHREQRYDFSVAPWRVLECLWPNVSGHMFPVNRRWLSALGGEDRIWTPTLYLGLLPLLIALSVWRVRTPDRHVQWLSLVALGSLVASFGWYGGGWLAAEIQYVLTGEQPTLPVGEPVGGLYWLMVKLLPGYAYFRYPAKLWGITSLALSLLSALGLERSLTSGRARTCRMLEIVGVFSLLAAMVFAVLGPWWSDWFASARPDELFGPLDVRGAWQGCLLACLQTLALCVLFWCLLRKTAYSPTRIGQLILLVTAVEIAWSNGSHVATAPAGVARTPSVLRRSEREPDRESDTANEAGRIYRPPRRGWVPPKWLNTSSESRCEATVRWDRATLFPKYHLLGDFGSVHTFSTMTPRDHSELMRLGGHGHPDPRVLDLLGVRYLVLPTKADWPGGIPLGAPASDLANVRVWRNPHAMPRAWIVHQVEAWPDRARSADRNKPVESTDTGSTNTRPGAADVGTRLRCLFDPEQGPRDFAGEAVVESRPPVPLVSGTGAADRCRIVEERVNRLEIEASLESPGLLVLSNRYDPGWSVEVMASNGSVFRPRIVRTNVVMQGVFLPPGTHRLVFRYVPRGFFVAATASILGWLICLVWVGVAFGVAVHVRLNCYSSSSSTLALATISCMTLGGMIS